MFCFIGFNFNMLAGAVTTKSISRSSFDFLASLWVSFMERKMLSDFVELNIDTIQNNIYRFEYTLLQMGV